MVSEEVGKWLILGKVYIPRNPVATGGSEGWHGKISMLPRHQGHHLTMAVRNLEKKMREEKLGDTRIKGKLCRNNLL